MKLAVRVLGGLLLAALLWGCGDGEIRSEPVSNTTIWGDGVDDIPEGEFIAYEDRSTGATYGLPRAGVNSIADLIALFPTEARGFDDADTFTAPGLFDGPAAAQCRGGAPDEIAELPMTVEGVVTVYPRQYFKVNVCGQDERNYGTFTIEDDTGGIVVLRDSRVAPYSYGDRVRVTVKAMMFTFGRDVDTRAILVSDIELAEPKIVDGRVDKTILFEKKVEPLGFDDASMVRQIEGYVHERPTNRNFGSMVLASRRFEVGIGRQRLEGELLQCARTCTRDCVTGGCDDSNVCADACTELCAESGGEAPAPIELPVCWRVGIDTEIQRRGFSPETGTRLRVTGPVVNNFDRQIWVLGLGQVDVLD